MADKRVTVAEWWFIYRWRPAGTGLREVVRRLGRAASSNTNGPPSAARSQAVVPRGRN